MHLTVHSYYLLQIGLRCRKCLITGFSKLLGASHCIQLVTKLLRAAILSIIIATLADMAALEAPNAKF